MAVLTHELKPIEVGYAETDVSKIVLDIKREE